VKDHLISFETAESVLSSELRLYPVDLEGAIATGNVGAVRVGRSLSIDLRSLRAHITSEKSRLAFAEVSSTTTHLEA